MAEARNPEDCTVLYKIVTDAEAESIPAKAWKGNALDLKDGFIHLSCSFQLPWVLNRFFSKDSFSPDVLFLYPLPRSSLRSSDQPVVFDAVGDTKFGHIYTTIDKDQFSDRIKIQRTATGEWHVPEVAF